VIIRKERPRPGAQLRITGIDGHRFTCFATSTKGGQLAVLELRHRSSGKLARLLRSPEGGNYKSWTFWNLRWISTAGCRPG
jgi:hypothetical protein